jgi:hypothetical protein
MLLKTIEGDFASHDVAENRRLSWLSHDVSENRRLNPIFGVRNGL